MTEENGNEYPNENEVSFEMPKAFDEIEEGKCADDGVYTLMLKTAPYTKQNNAKTGDNLLLDLMITEDVDENNGIVLTQYLPFPNSSDVGKTTRNGQPMIDWKMQNIKENVEKLGGTIEGKKFSIPEFAMCRAKVVRLFSEESPDKPYNRIEGGLMMYEG